MKDQFEHYLIRENYRLKSFSGNPSTVYCYINSVDKVCEREGYSWNMLASKIDFIVRKYDIGGIEEDFGNNGHRTVINALKRFQEFVDGDNKEIDEENLTLVEILGRELRQIYDNAIEKEKNTMIHLFGIQNGDTIEDLAYSYNTNVAEIVAKIVRASGIQSFYQAEVSKGVRLSNYVIMKSDVKLLYEELTNSPRKKHGDEKFDFLPCVPFEIKHDQKGSGTAIGYAEKDENLFLNIQFDDGQTLKFVFPDQFQWHLKATDAVVQKQIEDLIKAQYEG